MGRHRKYFAMRGVDMDDRGRDAMPAAVSDGDAVIRSRALRQPVKMKTVERRLRIARAHAYASEHGSSLVDALRKEGVL